MTPLTFLRPSMAYGLHVGVVSTRLNPAPAKDRFPALPFAGATGLDVLGTPVNVQASTASAGYRFAAGFAFRASYQASCFAWVQELAVVRHTLYMVPLISGTVALLSVPKRNTAVASKSPLTLPATAASATLSTQALFEPSIRFHADTVVDTNVWELAGYADVTVGLVMLLSRSRVCILARPVPACVINPGDPASAKTPVFAPFMPHTMPHTKWSNVLGLITQSGISQ